LFISSAGMAQISWDYVRPDTVFTFETTIDVVVYNNISFSDSGTYRWVREFSTPCSKITNAICDKNQCYLEHVDSASFFVEAGESFSMQCHFYPYNTCCKFSKCFLTVYKVADPTVRTEAEYNISLWCSALSTDDLDQSPLKLYPNPAGNYIQLDGINTINQNASITDVQGRLLQMVDFSIDGKIFIGDLSPGSYYLSCDIDGILVRRRFLKL
jgi:Secretion system C-terminal sorting domain